jgi:hypothetical protein
MLWAAPSDSSNFMNLSVKKHFWSCCLGSLERQFLLRGQGVCKQGGEPAPHTPFLLAWTDYRKHVKWGQMITTDH